MNLVRKLFRLALMLYPGPFRARFAEEMEGVFAAGLEEAQQRDRVAGFVLGEALRLPGSLADVYTWSLRTGESRQVALTTAGGGLTSGAVAPDEGWGASILAGLPHLLLAVVAVSPALLAGVMGTSEYYSHQPWVRRFCPAGAGRIPVQPYQGLAALVRQLAGLHAGVPLFLLSLAANQLDLFEGDWIYIAQVVLIPLALAYLAYKTACADRLRGLLAVLPLTAIIWIFFQELVPTLPRSLAWIWLCGIEFTAAVLILRSRRFVEALGLALAVPALGGLPFAYLGVYMGGTLPFSEPGPSPQEVVRQYLPLLLMTAAIVLGPQLAVKLRALGREYAKTGGRIFYRLALGGILLGLVVALLLWVLANSIGGLPSLVQSILLAVRLYGFSAAAVLYLAGFSLLVWAGLFSGALPGGRALGRLLALFVLLPGVPLVLVLVISSVSTGQFPGGWLLVAGFAWALAAAWMVTHEQ